MSDVILAAKALAAVPGLVVGFALMATEAPVYVGGGAVVVGLAGLFLRQFFANQAALWALLKERKKDNDQLRDRLHFAEWENAVLRHELGRQTDPGPYSPRPKDE